MSSVQELERQLAEARAVASAPTAQEAAVRLAVELSAQIDAAQRARVAAEKWLKATRDGVAKLYGAVRRYAADARKNPNERDVNAANADWALVCEAVRLMDLVARRFPGIAIPELPELVAPGFMGLNVPGLSVEAPGRLFPTTIVAWWSAAIRVQAWESEAATWVAANAGRLPDDLRAILLAAPPVTFVAPADPVRGGNEAAVLARMPLGLAQGAR